VYEEETPEQLEIYKYFHSQCFSNIDEFYVAFFEAAEKAHGARVREAVASDAAASHAAHAPFYTVSDRKFRYVRDIVLDSTEFLEIVVQMMALREYSPDSLINTLWLSADEVRELVRLGHSVGLHSHTHHRNMDTTSTDVQHMEYSYNHTQLCRLVHSDVTLSSYSPFCMAHPLGKMRKDTTAAILEKLDIRIGFLAHDDGTSECEAAPFAVPRIDHSVLLQSIRKKKSCMRVDDLKDTAQPEDDFF